MNLRHSGAGRLPEPLTIFFDHNVPRKLRRRLRPHLVTTAAQMGWAELSNGDLIQHVEDAHFDVFVTGDQGILYQQNHAQRRIPIVLISNTYWPLVDASAAEVLRAIEAVTPGCFTLVLIEGRSQA